MDSDEELVLGGILISTPEDLLYAYASLAHSMEFSLPIWEAGRRCCRCGKVVSTPESHAWFSFQTLVVDGGHAGFAHLFHCVDCPPDRLLPELKAIGTWPTMTETWKVVQGIAE